MEVTNPNSIGIELSSDAYPKNIEKIIENINDIENNIANNIEIIIANNTKIPKIIPLSQIHSTLAKYNIKISFNDIYYRPLTLNDIPELILLHKEWFPIEYTELFFQTIVFSKERNTFTIAACIKIEDKEFIVGSVCCEIVKEKMSKQSNFYAPFEHCNRTCFEKLCCYDLELCYILIIGVIDECRKIGLGTKLLLDVEKTILVYKPRCKGIYLHAFDYNITALKFYDKNGYKQVNGIKNYYFIENKYYDALVMFKNVRYHT